MVVTAFGCALIVPFVVVLKGQSAGHAMCISQQGVDICERHKSSIINYEMSPKCFDFRTLVSVLPSYGREQGPSLSVLYLFHKWWTFLFTTTKRPVTVTFHWEAPCSIFPLQRHHSTERAVSHLNVLRGCVLFDRLSPRQVLVPKLKRRCWETHFQSILRVGRSQSPSTKLERSTVMQRFSGSLSRMNRPFSGMKTKKRQYFTFLHKQRRTAFSYIFFYCFWLVSSLVGILSRPTQAKLWMFLFVIICCLI